MCSQPKNPSPVAISPSSRPVVRVVAPLFLPKTLDYLWAGEREPEVGALVQIEIGNKSYHGMVAQIVQRSSYDKLKLAHDIGLPVLPEQVAGFYRWVARYALSAPGDPLRAGLVSAKVPDRPDPAKELIFTGKQPARLTAQRVQVLEVLKQDIKRTWQVGELAVAADVSDAVVRSLVKVDMLAWQEAPYRQPQPNFQPVALAKAQTEAVEVINEAVAAEKFEPILLDGVMGSGKTEVYFENIQRILENGDGQVLVLVPEIALTAQWLTRFKERFGFEPVVWHAHISDKKRRENWWRVQEGSASVIVGARSSLFLPFKNLKYVVVDEEHDGSYKQEEMFRYHGRDMAIMLAKHWACPVVLASATPSLETWQNHLENKYKYLQLPSRFGGAMLPEVKLVDLCENGPEKADMWLSPVLIDEISEAIKRGEQSLLFLNRRGVAPLLICRTCGHRHDCPRCDASLVVHGSSHNGKLTCHHCGYNEPYPTECAKCESDKLHTFGPGTRKVMAEVQRLFPEARIAIADSDAISTPAQMDQFVKDVEEGLVDIIVGTQMVAKGHHFPQLTVVGVLDADMGLAHGDLRASERTFQLLMQVAGRAGRATKPGTVYLQTYDTQNPLMKSLKELDRDAFYEIELKSRTYWKEPPFRRYIGLILSAKSERAVLTSAQKLAQTFPKNEGFELLGPAPAPLSRLKDHFRYRLLVKSNKPAQGIVQKWLAETPIYKQVRLEIDVDPQRFS